MITRQQRRQILAANRKGIDEIASYFSKPEVLELIVSPFDLKFVTDKVLPLSRNRGKELNTFTTDDFRRVGRICRETAACARALLSEMR